MDQLERLDTYYRQFIQNPSRWLPEGILPIEPKLLEQLNLGSSVYEAEDNGLLQCFYVFESEEKITLVNERFAVWIAPQQEGEFSSTYVLIALLRGNTPDLELGFVVSGCYNRSSLILRILHRFLEDIEETEKLLGRLW